MTGPADLPRRARAIAADVAVVAVGLGVLGINRAQALRRDALRRLRPPARPEPHRPGTDAEPPLG